MVSYLAILDEILFGFVACKLVFENIAMIFNFNRLGSKLLKLFIHSVTFKLRKSQFLPDSIQWLKFSKIRSRLFD